MRHPNTHKDLNFSKVVNFIGNKEIREKVGWETKERKVLNYRTCNSENNIKMFRNFETRKRRQRKEGQRGEPTKYNEIEGLVINRGDKEYNTITKVTNFKIKTHNTKSQDFKGLDQ